MHPIPILGELLVVLAVSLVVVFLCHAIKVPSVVGFLLSGVLVGPGVLGLLSDRAGIDALAEIGVALLLFGIGLELSLKELARTRSVVLGAGGGQVLLTIAAGAGLALALGVPWREATFYGFLLALSSTAVVLTLLQASGDSASLHGRVTLSVLVLQDLAIVPLMLLTPLLGGGDTSLLEGAKTLGLAALAVVVILVGAARLVPFLLRHLVRTRSRELFTIFTVLTALGTAYLTGLAGLSLALGAFLAGLVVSESDYAAQALSEVLPLRDVFNSLFFVSVGMLVDPAAWLARPLLIGGLVVGVMALKAAVAGGVVLTMGFGLRIALLVGMALSQVGEFSFVLAHLGERVGLLGGEAYQVFLTVSVATMVLTPATLSLSQRLVAGLGRVPWLDRFVAGRRAPDGDSGHAALEGHVIICGYGLNGRNVARVLERMGVRLVVLELNAATVREERDGPVEVLYGDAGRESVLRHVGGARARGVVVTVADPASARRIVATARALNPEAYVLVRTRYISEVEALRRLGADDVVPEEFETSLELVGRVLAAYGAGDAAIEREKRLVRRDAYGLLRLSDAPTEHLPTLHELLETADVTAVVVAPDAPAAGETLRSLALRARCGVSVLALERDGEASVNPAPDRALAPGDRLFVFGDAVAVERARALFHSPPDSAPRPPAPSASDP